VLARICADKRVHVAQCRAARPLAAVEADARAAGPPRGFAAALRTCAAGAPAGTGVGAAGPRLALIAEIKRASPSRGLIRADFDPAALARAYADGGATCLSVLTDRPYFGGDDAYIAVARAACPLPVLRKDFLIAPYQIIEARALGADAVLLIMAALTDAEATELAGLAARWELDVLVEVHDQPELERALRLPPEALIGINNRNLRTLAIDLATTERLAPLVPEGRLLVAESGLYGHADLVRMAKVGAGAFLVGESLMKQADVTAATRALLGTDGLIQHP